MNKSHPSPTDMVRFLIDRRKLKQREIADYLGVSQPWVSNVYNRKRTQNAYQIIDKLAVLYREESRRSLY